MYVGCYSEAWPHNRIMMLYTTRLSWPTYLPCTFLYIIWCVQTADRRWSAKIFCVKEVSDSFSVDHPIYHSSGWQPAPSLINLSAVLSFLLPLEGNHLPLWISAVLPPRITSSPTSDSRNDTLEMQWEDFAGQFCIEILRYSLRLIFTGSVSYRPDHPLPSHHVFLLRLAASEGCLPQATCLSNSEPWIIIFCCLFSYFV